MSRGFYPLTVIALFASFVALGSGCASPVPGSANSLSSRSGKQMQVSLTFRNPVNPNYHYFFLINNSNNASGPWPQPVGSPVSGQTYGNGIATGSDNKSGGFTDFILYSNQQYAGAAPSNNFALYHVTNGTDANIYTNFVANGAPIQTSISTDGRTITFVIDLAQLYPSPTSQASAVNQALHTRWMQVNVVATNTVPTESQTGIIKEFDSLGDDSNGVGNYLLVDLNQQSYANNDGQTATITCSEPANDDVFVTPINSSAQDPQLDLVNWSVQIAITG